MGNENTTKSWLDPPQLIGRPNEDGTISITPLELKKLNDYNYAVSKIIQGGLNLANLNKETNDVFTGMVTFTDLSTGGKTTINGSNITTGTISANRVSGGTLEGVTFISTNPSAGTETVQIDNGEITLGQSAYGGQLKFDGTKVYLLSNLSPLKIESLMNLAIDSGGSYAIYIGTTNVGETINIGSATATINLNGAVINKNGVPI